ncbi:glycoside hydrolase family 15 protein [Haladaptatus halobius]|uniref:glycoside hydrolase family 15 protein n=1 Tax=Haladaptatus halobius TaxID=2884875 RepID=UPI001D0A8B61|nr:glycoside hydrolase family 15 protein [Haladaptatus halobius]
MHDYVPLEEYGLIGNLETCALANADGSIDWCPFPHLESPSVFARLLDAEDGGHFSIRPDAAYDSTQRYLDNTNVLRTEFQTEMGALSVTDFMPVTEDEDGQTRKRALYRKVECHRGTVDIDISLEPRFDYARASTTISAQNGGLLAESDDEAAFLSTDLSFDVINSEATATATVEADDTEWFIFCYGDDEPIDAATGKRLLDETASYWRGWAHTCNESECVFGGPWHDLVVRSGLTLKLLTHGETGAIAAAPTTSLPEDVGGVRNWDYRYNWIRDAAFTIQALSNLHHSREAIDYFDWVLDLCRTDAPEQIQPLYGLHGSPDLEEKELDHLAGYRNSSPVRLGNGAITQRQLDTYGELILAVYETTQDGYLSADDWSAIRDIIDYVCEVWETKDEGIWEVRGEPRHFVFSKVMCWVALDRGIAIANEHDFDASFDHWQDVRDEIKATVLERGYDDELGAFVQAFGDTDTLDATALLIPFVGFLPFDDERVLDTIDAIQEQLTTDDGLVYRYNGGDGLPGKEGAFVLCTFWLVDALALTGHVEEATETFLNVLDYVSPLGLLGEEIGYKERLQLGNYPQAFSHIGLINSALYIGRVSGRESKGFTPMALDLGDGIITAEDRD